MKQPTELPEDVREALGELLLEVFIENKNKKEYPVGQLEKRVGLLFSQELSKAQAKGERTGNRIKKEIERVSSGKEIQKILYLPNLGGKTNGEPSDIAKEVDEKISEFTIYNGCYPDVIEVNFSDVREYYKEHGYITSVGGLEIIMKGQHH